MEGVSSRAAAHERVGQKQKMRWRELGWGKIFPQKKNVEYGASYALMEDGVERGDLGPP
jgi:hypothetical protein